MSPNDTPSGAGSGMVHLVIFLTLIAVVIVSLALYFLFGFTRLPVPATGHTPVVASAASPLSTQNTVFNNTNSAAKPPPLPSPP